MLNPMFKVKEFNIHETNPFPIEVLYNMPGEKSTIKSMLLFDKGCSFPVTKSLSFDQRKDDLDVQLRYKHPIEQVYHLGNFKIQVPPPKEQNFTLVCKIKLDANMICSLVSSELIEDYVDEEKILKPKQKKEEKKKEDTKSEEPKKAEQKKEEATKQSNEPEPMADIKKEEPKKDEGKKAEAPKEEPHPMEAGEKKGDGKANEKKVEEEKMEVDEYEIKKVNKKRHTDIKYAFEMHGLSQKALTELLEREQQAAYADSIILATKSKKNECESYIYDTRNKLQSVLLPYVEEKVATELLNKFTVVQQWLYKEGKSVAKEEYEKKTEEMHKIGGPILFRYNQYLSLNDKLILLDNVVTAANTFNEKMKDAVHITNAERNDLIKLISEAEQLKASTLKSLENWSTKTSPPPTLPEEVVKIIEKIQQVKL
jgi:heat shock protein 4